VPALHGRTQRQRDREEAYVYLEELEAEQHINSDEERLAAYTEWHAQNCDSGSDFSELDSN
jgi:hypothetical protein